MKKLILSLLLIFSISSCGILFKSKKNVETEPTNFFMITLIERVMTYSQLDSLCVADNISSMIDDWSKMIFIDGETNKPIEQYLYMTYKGDTTFIYTALTNDNDVFVTKRIQYEN